MVSFQGEDIDFCIELDVENDNDMSKWEDAKEIIVYLYTDKSKISKYAYPIKLGYNPLNLVGNILYGKIEGIASKMMHGAVTMELRIKDNLYNDHIAITKMGNIVYSSQIKQEV